MAPGTATFTTYLLAETTCAEDCSLKGKPAKTPIIAGTICGTVMLIAWVVGFTIYCRKRRRRNRLLAQEGKDEVEIPPEGILSPDPEKSAIQPKPTPKSEPQYYKDQSKKHKEEEPQERVIIPPDPALLTGQWKPGEYVIPEKEKKTRPNMKSRFSSRFGVKGGSGGEVRKAGDTTPKDQERNGSGSASCKTKETESTSELLSPSSQPATVSTTSSPPQNSTADATHAQPSSDLLTPSQEIPGAYRS